MKTVRMDRESLNRAAIQTAHPFQAQVVKYLINRGWDVKSVIPNMVGGNLVGGVRVGCKRVVVISVTNDGLFAGVAPNGLVFGKTRSKNKIEWDWKRMADLADATIPAPHAAFDNLPEPV